MTPDKIVEKTQNAIAASNIVLIKELISDLEEKGIKPVVAIDGEVQNLRLIDVAELHDFHHQLKSANYSKDDFCVLEADELSDFKNKVIVVYKKSGKMKEYNARNSHRWVDNFAVDLKNNFFV